MCLKKVVTAESRANANQLIKFLRNQDVTSRDRRSISLSVVCVFRVKSNLGIGVISFYVRLCMLMQIECNLLPVVFYV